MSQFLITMRVSDAGSQYFPPFVAMNDGTHWCCTTEWARVPGETEAIMPHENSPNVERSNDRPRGAGACMAIAFIWGYGDECEGVRALGGFEDGTVKLLSLDQPEHSLASAHVLRSAVLAICAGKSVRETFFFFFFATRVRRVRSGMLAGCLLLLRWIGQSGAFPLASGGHRRFDQRRRAVFREREQVDRCLVLAAR